MDKAVYENTDINETIEDEGAGGEDQKDLFGPFYSTKTPSGKNTRLGLSLVYSIVKKYNGTISLKNRDGKGCRVTQSFPSGDL
jgi:signal transduction histidine kinase